MQLDNQVNYVQSKIIFGRLTDTPNIDYVPVKEMNNRIFYIPCQSLQIPIQKVIQNYLINSSCAKKFLPCLIIQQGDKTGQVALNNQILSSFSFNWKQVCFKVADAKDFRDSTQSDRRKRDEKSQNPLLLLKIIVPGDMNKYNLQIISSSRVIDLKRKAIQSIPRLKKMTPDLLTIAYNGLYITNQDWPLSKYKILSGSDLFIKIKIKQGCFSKGTLVTMADKSTVSIQNVKKGDEVLSYNLQKGIYETDIVTYVQMSIVEESLNIMLQNKTILRTTPNHLFLCEDKEFRCCSADIRQNNSRQTLQIGTSLLNFGGQPVRIVQILSSPNSDRQFYHLSISKNHNFIVDGLITHNMSINLRFGQDKVHKIDTNPSQTIRSLKQKIQMISFIQLHYQQLIAAGKILQDQRTISDYNIFKDTNIHLKIKKKQSFNLVRQGTKIRTDTNNFLSVEELLNGEQIASIDNATGELVKGGRMVQHIEKVPTSDYFQLGIGQFDKTIFLTSDSYVQLMNGEALSVRDICYQRGERQVLRRYNGQPVDTKGMAHHYIYPNKTENFYKISLMEGKNFIANDIILHDHVINILLFKNQVRLRKVTIGVRSQDLIDLVKKKLQAITNYPSHNIILSFNEIQLNQNNTIGSYQINSQHIVICNVLSPISKFGVNSKVAEEAPLVQPIQQKEIYLQIQTQKYVLNYLQNKHKTVQKIISQIIPNYNSSYFFIFGTNILFPNDPLVKLEQLNENFLTFSQNTIILVKNQKLSFLKKMKIIKEDIGNYSMVLQRTRSNAIISSSISAMSKIQVNENFNSLIAKAGYRIEHDPNIIHQEYKNKSFYLPFLQLTSRQLTHKINKYIIDFQRYKKQYQNNEQIFNIIKSLYINMQLLPNYLSKCYMGVANFKFSNYFKKQNTFYFHSFTIAFKGQGKDEVIPKKIQKSLKGNSGTLFHISSLTGKQIQQYSMFPTEGEILFGPFTYFLVEEIIPGNDYDEVYLVELSSPITFQKDIILWVDDNPKSIQKQVNKILNKQTYEILQATSTLEAVKWIKQFGWLINWKGLKFKIVSDKVRWQGIVRSEFPRTQNYYAGIDLLKILYNDYGFTVNTLIYCGTTNSVKDAAEKANNVQKKYYQITCDPKKLYKFLGIE